MCLIAIAGKGKDKYSEFFLNALKIGASTNTDGIGYAFKKHKTNIIYISKGFDNIEKAIKSIKSKRLGLKDELIVHLRIGNRGEVNTDMCHPFVLADNATDILQNNTEVAFPIMAHNGTFMDYTNCSIYSDTFQFIQEFMYQHNVVDMLIDDIDFFKKVFKDKLKQNRLVFLFPYEGIDLITLGEYIEVDNYLFSNASFRNSNIRNVGGEDITNMSRSEWEENWIKKQNRKYNQYNWRENLNQENSLRDYALSHTSDEDWEDNGKYHEEEKVNFPSPVRTKINLVDKGGIKISLPIKESINSKVGKRYGYREPDNHELKVSQFTDNDRFKDQFGVTFIEFMGFYVPVEFNTENQFDSLQVKPTKLNYNDLLLDCIMSDEDYKVKRGIVYTMVEIEQNHFVVVKRYLVSDEKAEFLTLPMYLLNTLFSIKPDAKNLPKYKEYYNLLRKITPSLTESKLLSEFIATKKFAILETAIWKGIVCSRKALELARYNIIEHLYKKFEVKSVLHKRSLV